MANLECKSCSGLTCAVNPSLESSNEPSMHESLVRNVPKPFRFNCFYTKKTFVNDHISTELADKLISEGVLLRATLRSSKNNTDSYATINYVSSSAKNLPDSCSIGSDIYICGPINRNRAAYGDIVAVKLLTELEATKSHSRYVIDHKNKTYKVTPNINADGSTPVANSKYALKKSYYTESTLSDLKPLPYGKIVSILHSPSDQPLVFGKITKISSNGCFLLLSSSSDDFMIHIDDLVKTTDISTSIQSFLEKKPYYIAKKLFWRSQYRFPIAKIIKPLGFLDFENFQNQNILYKYDIFHDSFSDSIIKSIPSDTWSVPKSEFKHRLDLTKECIFTVDPFSSKDLDDAISCWEMGDGLICVGVHIADVSYFIHQGSELDIEAQNRSTTVYLVNRAIQMIPPILSTNLCSLVPGKDRLAVSVIWKINKFGEIIDTWIGRSIIHSTCKLSYKDAQNVIDNGSLPLEFTNSKPSKIFASGINLDKNLHRKKNLIKNVENSIIALNSFAKILRKNRFNSSCLSIGLPKLAFSLDNHSNPTSAYIYELNLSNFMIEELMILANVSIARYIYINKGNVSFLRRHSKPLSDRLEKICSKIQKLGYNFDSTSAGTIQSSLNLISDPIKKNVTGFLLVSAFKPANYFCLDDANGDIDFAHHYALNTPLYTHYTSPIRRYPDIVVHRLLLACLNHKNDQTEIQKTLKCLTAKRLSEIANHSNFRKENAKIASKESTTLYLYKYLVSKDSENNFKKTVAYIYNIDSSKIKIFVPKFALETELTFSHIAQPSKKYSPMGIEFKLKRWKCASDFCSVEMFWDKISDQKKKTTGSNLSSDTECDLDVAMKSLNIKTEIIEYPTCLTAPVSPKAVPSDNFTKILRIFDKIHIYLVPELSKNKINIKPIYVLP
ncbi:hypothetical protein BB561_004214 [Smittium simulii]|uniref:RNB domain-containing protein n=1 Tax=Smittium simulii TaxID=133385 RepID=A0A2T9YHI7_9FUNG|nr:hypothetical protein BB561_004214 [Smittium simulii]